MSSIPVVGANGRSFPDGRVREILGAFVILSVLLVCAFSNVVFQGKSLIPTDNFNPMLPVNSEESNGPAFVPLQEWSRRGLLVNANFRDPGAAWWQGEPSAEFFRAALQDGELPFWDPYIGAGTPSMANLLPAYFFPPSVALIVLGNTSLLKNIYYQFLLIAAGIGTFALLRNHSISWSASLVGAICFTFSGGLIATVSSFLGQPVVCLPYALLLTSRFIDVPTWNRTIQLGAGFALISLASFPPLLLAVFGFSVLYFLVAQRFIRSGHRAQLIRRFVVGVVLSLTLSAFYWVPAILLLRSSPQVADAYQNAAIKTVAPRALLQLFTPTLMGGIQIYANPAMPAVDSPYLYYSGLISIGLALLARPGLNTGSRRLFWFLVFAFFLVLGKLLGIPPVQWIAHLPGLRTIHFASYFGIPLSFLIALLAALGFETLRRNEVRFRGVLLSLIGLGVGILMPLRYAKYFGIWNHAEAWRWIADYRLACMYVLIFFGVILWILFARRHSSAALAVLIIALGIESIGNNWYPRQNRWDVWRHPVRYVEKFQNLNTLDRVFSVGALSPNTNSSFRIMGVHSLMAFNSPRLHELYGRYTSSNPEVFMRDPAILPPERILDRLAVRFVLVNRGLPDFLKLVGARPYKKIYQDRYVELYERNSLPRYFFSSEYRLVFHDALLELISSESRPRTELLLESRPSFRSQANLASDPSPSVEAFRRNSYRVRVNAPRPGLVYMSETYMPGWSAWVNGKPTRLLRANHSFRAVEVPSGKSEVVMSYFPPGLKLGAVISGISVMGVLLMLIFYRSEARLSPVTESPRQTLGL